jgi:YbbR domain-containing protein
MRWLVGDSPLKLLAVAIAATVWAVVVSGDRGLVSLAVPIEYVGLDRDLVLTDAPRETANVEVAVARWAGSRFRPDVLRVRVDLSAVGEGDGFVALSAGDVQAPVGVRVRRVAPARLRVHLVRVSEATLRIVPVVRGRPAPGHRVAAVRVDPIAVQVKGPRSTIEARDTVQTAPVDVAGRRSSVTRSVGLALPDAVSPVNDGKVQVTVDIQVAGAAALHGEGSPK